MNLNECTLYVPDSSSEELSRKGTPPNRPDAPAATDDIPSIGEKHLRFFSVSNYCYFNEFIFNFYQLVTWRNVVWT
jgi:hypothetical protein